MSSRANLIPRSRVHRLCSRGSFSRLHEAQLMQAGGLAAACRFLGIMTVIGASKFWSSGGTEEAGCRLGGGPAHPNIDKAAYSRDLILSATDNFFFFNLRPRASPPAISQTSCPSQILYQSACRRAELRRGIALIIPWHLLIYLTQPLTTRSPIDAKPSTARNERRPATGLNTYHGALRNQDRLGSRIQHSPS